LNSVSYSFPRGVLLATAKIVNCFYITGSDLKKAIKEQVKVNLHGHEISTLDSPIGEPLEDVRLAADSDSWESYVWELNEVKPVKSQVPVTKNSRSTWVTINYYEQ
jgi:hypothetical protein